MLVGHGRHRGMHCRVTGLLMDAAGGSNHRRASRSTRSGSSAGQRTRLERTRLAGVDRPCVDIGSFNRWFMRVHRGLRGEHPGNAEGPHARGPSCFRSRFGSPNLRSGGPVARPCRRGLATLTSNRTSRRNAAEAARPPLWPVRNAAPRRTRLFGTGKSFDHLPFQPPCGGSPSVLSQCRVARRTGRQWPPTAFALRRRLNRRFERRAARAGDASSDGSRRVTAALRIGLPRPAGLASDDPPSSRRSGLPQGSASSSRARRSNCMTHYRDSIVRQALFTIVDGW